MMDDRHDSVHALQAFRMDSFSLQPVCELIVDLVVMAIHTSATILSCFPQLPVVYRYVRPCAAYGAAL